MHNVIGSKSWLAFGSANGGKTGGILSTILDSARRHGLNEYGHRVDLLERLSDLPSENALRYVSRPVDATNTVKRLHHRNKQRKSVKTRGYWN